MRCEGRAGHSGYPSEGESAIHRLIPVLNDILNYKWPSDDTYGKNSHFATGNFLCLISFFLNFLTLETSAKKILRTDFERA